MSWLASIVAWFVKTDPLIQAGERAAQEAERLWALDIVDPPADSKHPQAARWLAEINRIIHDCGWTWIDYKGNEKGANQWCGEFAAACWRKAGIDPKWLADFWASTLRMWNFFRYRAWNEKSAGPKGGRQFISVHRDMAKGSLVFPDGTTPRRGDIVVVGTGSKPEGHHINVLVGFDAETGVFHTISGNGGGLGPDGKHREGVVKKDYTADSDGYRVLFVYRVGVEDLIAP